MWTGNAEESAALSGVTGVEETAQVVATLLRPDAVTIVRDGPRGCAVREGGRTAYLPGHPQRPVDTNGAGDTHTGVLLAERAAGASWTDAAVRANAAGAIKVTRRGPDTRPRVRRSTPSWRSTRLAETRDAMLRLNVIDRSRNGKEIVKTGYAPPGRSGGGSLPSG